MMKMIAFTFFLFVSHSIFAQAKTSIDPDYFDYGYLEERVMTKINQLRTEHKCAPLLIDSALVKAAKHHTNYMATHATLSHYENKDKAMRTPQKRAEYYHAEGNGMGENILYTLYNTHVIEPKNVEFKTFTYDILADAILHAWVTSPGHFKNIISPTYTTTGLAISIDKNTKRVYVCQEFMKVKE